MRVIRILGELEIFAPLLEEAEMSPNEYFEFVKASKKKQRKRGSKSVKTDTSKFINRKKSEW